jgi:hypothetical protein
MVRVEHFDAQIVLEKTQERVYAVHSGVARSGSVCVDQRLAGSGSINDSGDLR